MHRNRSVVIYLCARRYIYQQSLSNEYRTKQDKKKTTNLCGLVAYILENIVSYNDAKHSLTFFSMRAATSSLSSLTNFSPTIFSYNST